MTLGKGPVWSVGVVIPAQDEAATIEGCITSILNSFAACVHGENIWIVVVADACRDRTAAIAREVLDQNGEVIECSVRSPGTARRVGVDAVLDHFRHVPRNRIWLANTDADTTVPRDWLDLHLAFAQEGESAVAGIVELESVTDERCEVAGLFREIYQVHKDGTHTHVHGANFGVRADAYLDVGGWSHLPLAEDHCLWGRLKRAGWRLRASARSVVTTSARLRGRARGGFADTLRAKLEGEHG